MMIVFPVEISAGEGVLNYGRDRHRVSFQKWEYSSRPNDQTSLGVAHDPASAFAAADINATTTPRNGLAPYPTSQTVRDDRRGGGATTTGIPQSADSIVFPTS